MRGAHRARWRHMRVGRKRSMPTKTHNPAAIKRGALAGAVSPAFVVGARCGDDDAPRPRSSGTTTPFVGAGSQPSVSSVKPGGPEHTVLNNQPRSPAVNNAPPGSNGSG